MSLFKRLIKLSALLFLLIPITSYADVKIILGSPYYKYKHYNHYNPANSYIKRHNFGNNRFPTNPYLNNEYSYYSNYKYNRSRHTITYPSLGFNYGTPYRNNYGYNHSYNKKFNHVYRRGYQQGYHDAKRERHYKKHSKLGK